MRIGPAANVARVNVGEVISALWSFSHANGLLTDDINERTAGAGVTVDGVRMLDNRIDLLRLAQFSYGAYTARVSGDAVSRYSARADGELSWGDGTNPLDTKLYRAAADVLKTDDAFHCAGPLNPLENIILSSRDATMGVGDNNNVATGAVTLQRLTCDGGGSTVTGFAGGVHKRLLAVLHIGPSNLTLAHLDAGSDAANQLKCMDGTDVVTVAGGATLWIYDTTVALWCQIASN